MLTRASRIFSLRSCSSLRAYTASAAFAAGPADWAALWQRDHNLLNIAAGARAKRLDKALQALHLAAH